VLMTAGVHTPVIAGLFVDLPGRTGGGEFRQRGPICVKVGVICVTTVMFIVVVVTH